ncbi:unnamed protein product [Cochlearia groenlandica]
MLIRGRRFGSRWLRFPLLVTKYMGNSPEVTAQKFVTGGIFDEKIDMGSGKLSLGHTLFRSVKSTHTLHFFVILFYHHRFREPPRVFDLSYRFETQQPLNFIVDRLSSTRSELSSFLSDRFKGRIDVKPMNSYPRIDPSHIFGAPCKYVFIIGEELDQCFFLRICELCANL